METEILILEIDFSIMEKKLDKGNRHFYNSSKTLQKMNS